MLDQMSGGRFLYGVGRGISPIEVGFYGVDFATGIEQFREAFEVIRSASPRTSDLSRQVLRFRPRADAMKPVQKPYPELWYGIGRPDSIPWAARRVPIS